MESMSDKLKVGIINTNTSNLNSVQLACKKVGLVSKIIDGNKNLNDFGGLILPGVGAFDKVASRLFQRGLDEKIKKFIETGKPLLGICLGFQLLFDYSEEFDGHRGLGILEGRVKKIPINKDSKKKIKVPFIGWGRIKINSHNAFSTWEKDPLSLIPDNTPMYFVHSYYVNAIGDFVSSTTNYEKFTCCGSISLKNIFACQFHPEKSANYGLSIFDCLTASLLATKAIAVKRSIRFNSRLSKQSSRLNLSSPAICTLYILVSNEVIGPIPFVPFSNPLRNSWVELPIGDRIPVPVTTTRLDMRISLDQLI